MDSLIQQRENDRVYNKFLENDSEKYSHCELCLGQLLFSNKYYKQVSMGSNGNPEICDLKALKEVLTKFDSRYTTLLNE